MRLERLTWDFTIKTIAGAPAGMDALVLGDLARLKKGQGSVLHIARDETRAQRLATALRFFAPGVKTVRFPAWDCLPYDRVSPNPDVASARVAALARLSRLKPEKALPHVVIATINAATQRVPPPDTLRSISFSARSGNDIDLEALTLFLERNGYARASTVMDPGDYAVRGGIVDVFPPGQNKPLRLDLFGDQLESVRLFDPDSQRSTKQLSGIDLFPVSEVLLDDSSIARFRKGYLAAFGAVTDDDPLYESVSAGRKHQGMEHWLPLFHDNLATLFDYLHKPVVTLDHLADDAADKRFAQIEDHFEARDQVRGDPAPGALGGSVYKPLNPDALYLTSEEWESALSSLPTRRFSPFDAAGGPETYDAGARPARDFSVERRDGDVNLFDTVGAFVKERQAAGKRTLLAFGTEGTAERTGLVLADHGLDKPARVKTFDAFQGGERGLVATAVCPLEHGFETDDLLVLSEGDILGDRIGPKQSRTKKAQNFLKEASSLSPEDFVVHVDHGIGRYHGLETIDVQGAPHDCLELRYAGGDKLFLPVENIELLSRYGDGDGEVVLDRLGGAGWQSRKAKLKQRLREMADQLIKLAAERALRKGDLIEGATGAYEEFAARFPYEETDDQLAAIHDVMEDLGSGRPMDRLVCGDVGFGKTEVALRAAFLVAMSGRQVAVVAPTTLLARQHTKSFEERFAGWPLNVRQLSRFVSQKDAADTRAGMRDGSVDIVIGTHALLAKSTEFNRLGLLIVDEEQHFGVGHKERLKQLRANVHVLTLTATPIPRTLQMALTGMRELSIIATPPVDRLAVRTFVSPFDPVVVREAVLREHYRGGQSFYVCPRISDLPEAEEFLKEFVPEVKAVAAHGQMPAGRLEEIMNGFYDGKFDVLLATTIIESGLDIPTANTLIVHRADMFGLAQLYQIRGRIGRSKQRAYAYLTYPVKQALTRNAEKRLKVLQTLDTLGAGFNLASHDLDIRGAGNLLGEEQSGHIREVGVELFQQMLEEAVASLRSGDLAVEEEGTWSPQINTGAAVLIPEDYVADLDVRLALYRRLSEIKGREAVRAFAAELHDRFGPVPKEVEHLLKVITIKGHCRDAHIDKVDAGPKGLTLSFRNNSFPNPEGLLLFIGKHQDRYKLRPDHKVVVRHAWPDPEDRLKGSEKICQQLATIALGATKDEPHRAAG
ncbi:MAG: transcription-repair coupling factor [Pseudomonadota bacterium]